MRSLRQRTDTWFLPSLFFHRRLIFSFLFFCLISFLLCLLILFLLRFFSVEVAVVVATTTLELGGGACVHVCAHVCLVILLFDCFPP